MLGRKKYIDIAKAFGICLVIFGHLICGNGYLSNIIFSFHMPLFFLLSGYTEKRREMFGGGWGEYIALQFKRLIFPYILFYAITVLFVGYFDLNGFVRDTYLAHAGAYNNFSGHLWFLVCLFFVKLLAFIFNQFYDSGYKYVALIFLIIIFSMTKVFPPELFPYCRYPFKIDSAIIALPFYLLGQIVSKKDSDESFPFSCPHDKRLIFYICVIFALVGLLFEPTLNGSVNIVFLQTNDIVLYYLFAIIGCFAVISISKLIEHKIKYFHLIGKYSLYFFMFHWLFILLWVKIVSFYRHQVISAMGNMAYIDCILGLIFVLIMTSFCTYIYLGIFKYIKHKIYGSSIT